MVDSISGKQNGPIHDAALGGIGQSKQAEQVEKLNREAAKVGDTASVLQSFDNATISDAAKEAYKQEKEILQFSRLAQRIKEPFDTEKVARIKNLLDSGRINEYLRDLNTDELAQSLIDSPSGAFLR